MEYLVLLIPTGATALPALNVRKPLSVQQVSDSLALDDAEDHGAIHGRSGVLLGVDGGDGGAVPS